MPDFVLARTSKYRKTLLQRLGLNPECIAPGVDEEAYKLKISDPLQLAESLAMAKAQAVALKRPGSIVIGGDQLLTIHGQILGKPGSEKAAVDQLELLSGKTHTLITAMAVIGPDGQLYRHTDHASLTMRSLSRADLERYVARDLPIDCAGSYKLEESGIALFDRVQTDDFNAITGLPLLALVRILTRLGLQLPA